jgi:molecular chaperone GrpE (heat shock protein)
MSEEKIIAAVSKVGSQDKAEKLKRMPNQDHFEELMKQSTTETNKIAQEAKVEEASKTSPMDAAKKAAGSIERYPELSAESLVAQAQDAINKIDNLKRDLQTPNLELKGSVQTLLKSKLEHIDDNLKVALNKIGSEYEDMKDVGIGKPIERFINFLTHSQYQLDNLAEDVQLMHLNGEEISPASMLAVQIKVNYVQQELEFFTSLLNKALESTKTIMNVQV